MKIKETINDDQMRRKRRFLVWSGALAASTCSYTLLLWASEVSQVGIGALQVLIPLGLFFFLGFCMGPIALAYFILVLIAGLREIVFPTGCCSSAGSDGSVGFLVMGSSFVGSTISTYLLAVLFWKKRLLAVWVVGMSFLLSAIWLAISTYADKSCLSRPCTFSLLPNKSQNDA